VERQDRRAVPLIHDQLFISANPLGRIHALWALAGLGALDAAALEQAARDAHPGVRENALRASAQIAAPASRLPLRTVLKLAGDFSIRVRLQAALAVGRYLKESPSAVHALVSLAMRDADDSWMRLAIQSDLAETALPFLKEWIETYPRVLDAATHDQLSFLSEVAAIVGVRRRDQDLRSLLELVMRKSEGGRDPSRRALGRLTLLAGLGAGMDRSGSALHAWLKDRAGMGQGKADGLAPLWRAARDLVLSDGPAAHRRIALEALVRGQPGLAGPIIPRLLLPDQPATVQSAAARAVGRVGGAELAAQLLDSWSELALGTRRELCAALLGSPITAGVLVAALEKNQVAAVELDAASRDALLRLADAALRKRALAVLARSAPADRSAVVARYQAALKLRGDSSRGASLFAKNCQTCHQLQGQGHRAGPDLSGIAGRLPAVLLNDILDPNRDVAPDFVALTVATERGQVLSGLLVEDTGSSLKLRQADGIDETVLRSETAEIHSTGRSLMPEGLEQSLNLQEMADLLAFLRSGLPLNPSKEHVP
ncbi:MAG: c-type cytochrome, partial [Isosphaeraceae bacterium]